MTPSQTPVAAAAAPPVREGKGRLPTASLPKERWLRPGKKSTRAIGTFVGTFVGALGALVAIDYFAAPAYLGWGVVGLWTTWFAAHVIKIRRFNVKNSALVSRLNQGDPGALPEAEALCKKYKRTHSAHHVAVYNLAVLAMLTGDPQRALSLFAAFWRSKSQARLRQVVGFHIATCHALLGDLAAADSWLEEANKRVKLAHLRADVFPLAILRLRRGEKEAAERLLVGDWARAETLYVGKLMHALHALRAFAASQRGELDEDQQRALIGNAKLAAHGLGFLVVDWPELRAFLVDAGVDVD